MPWATAAVEEVAAASAGCCIRRMGLIPRLSSSARRKSADLDTSVACTVSRARPAGKSVAAMRHAASSASTRPLHQQGVSAGSGPLIHIHAPVASRPPSDARRLGLLITSATVAGINSAADLDTCRSRVRPGRGSFDRALSAWRLKGARSTCEPARRLVAEECRAVAFVSCGHASEVHDCDGPGHVRCGIRLGATAAGATISLA